jgi:hypothetical protein
MGRVDRKTKTIASEKLAAESAVAAFIDPMLLLRTDALPSPR